MTRKEWMRHAVFVMLVVAIVVPLAYHAGAAILIDMEAVYVIESDGNHHAISEKGARGQGQIMKATWNECTKRMGVNWKYETCWYDPAKNTAVAEYYMKHRIPSMLKAYKIPVTKETTLATYNCGIGRVKAAWEDHGAKWKSGLPRETRNYLVEYKTAVAKR